MDWMSTRGLTSLPHPPYSPDIAPSDFGVFGTLKDRLKQVEVDGIADLCDTVRLTLTEVIEPMLPRIWGAWMERLRWVIEHGGEYYSK
jgi:hypothetical protein